jgi:hypothetical protein
MRRNRFIRRVLAAILFALALPHADPGGLIHCVRADGTSSFEFACGCVDTQHGCCDCCDCGSDSSGCDGLVMAEKCSGCSDFHMSFGISASGAQLDPPTFQLAAAPAILPDFGALTLCSAAAGEQVPRLGLGPPLRPPPARTVILRI